MRLADFIETNKDRLIERWKELVVSRLSLELETTELVNDLPELIAELIAAAREPEGEWPTMESARSHGRHRMRAGVDIGGLTVEMALIAEVVILLADEDDCELSTADLRLLSRLIGRGTAASVNAYAAMRDRQLATQAAEHFSFIAHEIRNPLQNARLATLLLADGDQQDRGGYLARLDRSLAQLSELVDNSLAQARLYGEPDLNIERLGARELVEAAREDTIGPAGLRAQTIAVEVEDFELDGDRRLLVSALTNLLDNAVKFTADRGCITIRARKTDGRALFEIEDQCGGMPEDLPGRLFQPFVQAEDDKRGFGLGLAIIKQAVEAHGGSARVANRPGDGCTFVLDLPLRQPDGDD